MANEKRFQTSLSDRELAVILGALREYQNRGADKAKMDTELHSIYTNGGEFACLTYEEVDELCIRLNVE
jgi:hypothetical protein